MNELKPPMLKREDYKAIKHMNREDMTKYLYRVYRRGFDAGVESTKGKVTKRSIVPPRTRPPAWRTGSCPIRWAARP